MLFFVDEDFRKSWLCLRLQQINYLERFVPSFRRTALKLAK